VMYGPGSPRDARITLVLVPNAYAKSVPRLVDAGSFGEWRSNVERERSHFEAHMSDSYCSAGGSTFVQLVLFQAWAPLFPRTSWMSSLSTRSTISGLSHEAADGAVNTEGTTLMCPRMGRRGE
jgi:hypothetical protein